MRNLTLLIKSASGACQYNCEYCFYKDELGRRKESARGIMSEQTLENLVRRAFAAAENQVTFAFQGGEPTLAGREFFEKLDALQQRYSRGKAYANSLQTNGGLIDENWARFLKQRHFLVGLSLDGDRQSHDTYRKDINGNGTWQSAKNAAELLKKHDVPFNVLSVVSKANVNRARETYEELKPYKFIQFIPCLDALGSEKATYAPTDGEYANFLIETFELYERDILKGDYTSVRLFDNYIQMLAGARPESCAMNGRCSVSFTIESDGSVYPCDFYCLDEWRLGSINESGFITLSNCEIARQFVNSSLNAPQSCLKCKYYSLCRGGCRRERENAEALNRYCKSYIKFFDTCYERLLKLKSIALGR